ncbi:MAG: squalene synthase HpnC [Methylophaga sp.]|nr:squalene synthase HpnC [Methylophaga sp.]
MTQTSPDIDEAYAWCQKLAKSHYENFPVASVLLPRHLRGPIAAIYAFARTADDFADEGDASQAERLTSLNNYSALLRDIETAQYRGSEPVFLALQDAIHRYSLPVQLFEDLLIAFRQDVVKSRYASFEEVLDYCRYSANPVGRLLLHLDGYPDQHQLEQSDAICTALQLINFFQDIEQDFQEQNRVYIPLDEMAAAGLTEHDLIQTDSRQLAPLIRSLYQRATSFMSRGYPLGMTLSGRLGWEVRAMTLGGITTLKLLQKQTDFALMSRPRLSRWQLISILILSADKNVYQRTIKRLLNN